MRSDDGSRPRPNASPDSTPVGGAGQVAGAGTGAASPLPLLRTQETSCAIEMLPAVARSVHESSAPVIGTAGVASRPRPYQTHADDWCTGARPVVAATRATAKGTDVTCS